MITIYAHTGGLVVLLAVAGCQNPPPPPIRLDLATAQDSADKKTVAPSAHAWRIQWQPLDDRRMDATSLGNIGQQNYVTESVLPWVDVSLRKLAGKDFCRAGEGEEPGGIITPRLHKLYIQNVDITKSASVVIELDFCYADGPVETQIYRGTYAGMNWWNSDEEMARALRTAFADCIRKIAGDLERRAHAQPL